MGCTSSRPLAIPKNGPDRASRGKLRSPFTVQPTNFSVSTDEAVALPASLTLKTNAETDTEQTDGSPVLVSSSSSSMRTSDPSPTSQETHPDQPELVIPPDETRRLATLSELGVINKQPERRFDSITSLMKAIYGTPVCAITLIGKDVIHMHSRAGEWACCAPRRGSFCDWILDGQCPRMLVVEDALHDERFARNKFVRAAPHVRFYAGCPLVGSTGHRYGTLCIVDFAPRRFTAEQYAILTQFAELATRELERDHMLQAPNASKLKNEALAGGVRGIDALEEAIMLTDVSQLDWPIVYANEKMTNALDLDSNSDACQTFWQIFGGRATDHQEVARALACVRKKKPFEVTLQAGTDQGSLFTVRFKHVSDVGTIGKAKMPRVPVPSGIFMDRSTSNCTEGESLGRPMQGKEKSERSGLASNLSTSQREALVAALSSDAFASADGTTPYSGMASIDAAARAAVAVVEKVTEEFNYSTNTLAREPVYYLGVIDNVRPIPQRHLLDEGMNNAVGRTIEGSGASIGSENSTHTSTQSACPWDSVTSQDQGWYGGKKEGSGATWTSIFDSNRDSHCSEDATEACCTTDHPPSGLKELQLGAMVGCGALGRVYRGVWRGRRVAVKVADYWEEIGELGSSPPKKRTIISGLGGGWPSPEGPPSDDDMLSAATPLGIDKIRHQDNSNLVPVYCAAIATNKTGVEGRIHRRVWLIEKFCDMGSLADALDRGMFRHNLAMTLLAALDVANAMCALHVANVLHGSLTGSNVLLSSTNTNENSIWGRKGRGWKAMVADYGLVRGCASDSCSPKNDDPIDEASLWNSRFLQPGSVAHLPPEVLLGGELTPAADVYSFGVLLWEMWEGRQAWRGMGPVHILHAVGIEGCRLPALTKAPAHFERLVTACLANDEASRPAFSTLYSEIMVLLRLGTC